MNEQSKIPGEDSNVVDLAERQTVALSLDGTFKGKALRANAGGAYAEGTRICIDRARYLTESYMETEGEPMVIRRAKALANVLDKMTLHIQSWEKVVGCFASDEHGIQLYPELFSNWVDKAIDKEYRHMVTDDEREELHEINKYWKNRSVHGKERRIVPPEVKPYAKGFNHGAFFWTHGSRTGVADYDKALKIGLRGVIDELKAEMDKLTTDPAEYVDGKKYIEKRRFLEAAIIALEAGARWGHRYAALARQMAENEQDLTREAELLNIAAVCDQVPEGPAQNFRQALQSYYFIMLITRVIDLQTSGLGDRFDQLMNDYYVKDIESGEITEDYAEELMEQTFLKMNEYGEMVAPFMSSGTGGGFVVTTRLMTIGGMDRDGKDAVNEMSYATLRARSRLSLTQPTVAIRISRDTPEDFLFALTDAVREMPGVYSIFNDHMMIPYITQWGVPEEEARNYAKEGCMRWVLPGKPMGQRALGGIFALPRCLEYVFSQGVNTRTGEQMGARTKDPEAFTSFEGLVEAYFEQLNFFASKCITLNNVTEALDNEWLPQPFLSALMDGCKEEGKDLRDLKYVTNSVIQSVGQITMVNSLLALKKLVFDDKTVSIRRIMDALDTDWAGEEELRQMCINAPKFGNDDDTADDMATWFYKKVADTFRSYKDIYGGPFREDGTGGSTYFAGSLMTGATPDGRMADELFNDGTISPVPDTDVNGPTAVLKSLSKIDHVGSMTNCFNQKFAPQFLLGENKAKFVAYLQAFVELGIHHIQFNIFDQEYMRNAQANPEEYSNMVVRVAGYSAYFTDLNPGLQNQIIARTPQSFR
jgi:pyruvate formate-lyase/glycerol dehydratase family glycyl radical enzyme